MTKRLLSPTLLTLATLTVLASCTPPDDGPATRLPYVDDWETVATLPAAQFDLISIGDRVSSDNFANRGDIEVRYEGSDAIIIEMQRFTVAADEVEADENFDRMQYWGYALSSPSQPSDDNFEDQCINPDPDVVDRCYIRAYYDGLFQPSRDGANFRVTLPVGWDGDLFLVTSDNLEEGIDTYPDRGDIIVDGLNGNLEVDMDSGNIDVRMDPNIAHYAGCGNSQACEDSGHEMGCGCSVPTNVIIKNNNGQSSNITVDVGDASNWYTMLLANNATITDESFICEATIDCSEYSSCTLDEAYTGDPQQERAEINYPEGAAEGAGIRIDLTSDGCSNVKYVNGPDDHGSESLPEEKRGEVMVCVGCLDSL